MDNRQQVLFLFDTFVERVEIRDFPALAILQGNAQFGTPHSLKIPISTMCGSSFCNVCSSVHGTGYA